MSQPQKTREPMVLTPLDLENLPGIDVDLPPAEWRAAVSAVTKNLLDPETPANAKRIIKFAIGFTPEPDRRTARVRLKTAPVATLVGHDVAPRMLVIDKGKGSLEAGYSNSQDEDDAEAPFLAPEVLGHSIPLLSELWGGLLDSAYRRALVVVLLNLDDPRTSEKERTITVKVALIPNAGRDAVRFELLECTPAIAGPSLPNSDTLYLEPDLHAVSYHWEPKAFMPQGEGRQETVPGSEKVVEFKRT